MPKIDVHLLHMPNGIEIVGDISSPHIVVRHKEGIVGNTLNARLNAFALGSEPYISFVDPDDEVNVDAFKICLDELEANPELGGVYTNSTIIHHNPNIYDRPHFLDHVWSKEYHMSRMNPIHQLTVMRRSVYEQIIEQMLQDITPFRHLLLSYSEQIMYAYIASVAPWKFINVNGYNWYKRVGTNHSNASIEITNIVRAHIKEILTRSMLDK